MNKMKAKWGTRACKSIRLHLYSSVKLSGGFRLHLLISCVQYKLWNRRNFCQSNRRNQSVRSKVMGFWTMKISKWHDIFLSLSVPLSFVVGLDKLIETAMLPTSMRQETSSNLGGIPERSHIFLIVSRQRPDRTLKLTTTSSPNSLYRR
jgi:hypothetical protein